MSRTEDQNSARHGDPDERSHECGCVRLIAERFPHVRLVSLRLLIKDEAFRELCEEYEVCSAAVERFARPVPNVTMLREYTALQLRLEGELLRYFSRHGSGDPR
jgi:hypothetical protein